MRIMFPRDLRVGILIIFLGLASTGCSTWENPSARDQGFQNYPASSPTSGTSVYRYLSAISNAYPDDQSLTDLCIRKHGFKLELPVQGIATVHEISLPALEESSEFREVATQEYTKVIIQPPSVNGIVMQAEEKLVPYAATKNEQVKRIISGTCIGTEYILK